MKLRAGAVIGVLMLFLFASLLSVPTIGGFFCRPSMAGIDEPPRYPTTRTVKPNTNVSRKGAVLTTRVDVRSAAVALVFWKGSLHFQIYSVSRDCPLERGVRISPAHDVVVFFGPSAHWTEQPYSAVHRGYNFAGFMARVAPAYGYPYPQNTLYAFAIPLWFLAIPVVIWLLRILSKTQAQPVAAKVPNFPIQPQNDPRP